MTEKRPHKKSPRVARVFERVRESLLESIRKKELKPGDKLPSERNLADRYSASRSAVREALRTLESSGVLRFEKGKSGGAFVRDHSSDGMIHSFRSMILLGEMPFSDLVQVRLALLQLAVELAAHRALEDDLARLDANIDVTEAVVGNGDPFVTIAPIMEFNTLLGAASHNPVLQMVIEMLVEIMQELLKSLALPTDIDLVSPRRRVVALIREGRAAEARQAISEHLSQTTDYVLSLSKLD